MTAPHGDYHDGKTSLPHERTDTITELILEWDKNGESNPYMTIDEVIEEWENDLETNDDLTQQELGDLLYDKHQYEWNDGYKRGRKFLVVNEDILNYEIINAIEDLYIYTEWGHDYLNKSCLEDKLDIIYYFKAEEAFRAIQDEHEVYALNWN